MSDDKYGGGSPRSADNIMSVSVKYWVSSLDNGPYEFFGDVPASEYQKIIRKLELKVVTARDALEEIECDKTN